MATLSRILFGVLAVCLFPAAAQALTTYTFEGTTPDTLIDVLFTADLTISGDTLTIVLTNDSLNHSNGASPSLNPNDILSSFYFDIDSGGSAPTLTWVSATGDVYLGDKDNPDTEFEAAADLKASGTLSHLWDFRQTLTIQPGTEVLRFGIGAAGNNSLSPNGFSGVITDGVDQGLYAGDVSTANLNNVELVRETATFVFSGLTGFTEADLSTEALFGLGTQPDSTAFVPEPSTGLLLAMGLFGLAWCGRWR